MRNHAASEGLQELLQIESAGTGSWHVGNPPDRRAQKITLQHGIDITGQRARQFDPHDFQRFDFILAMDRQNLIDVTRMADADYAGTLKLFLDFAPGQTSGDVPDPYYGGEDGFTQVLEMLDVGCTGFIRHLRTIGRLG